jgi:predicted component of type VI protein secretion system
MSDISGDTFGQGSKLSFSFGTRPAERKKYKSILWYAADLGGPALDENVTSDSRDNLLPGLAAVAAFSVPNLLGSEPQFLHVNIRPQSLKDFAPGALAGAVPAVAAGLELRRRAANGETREALRGDFKNFEHLLAEVIAVTPTNDRAEKAKAADLDRLFSMLDTGDADSGSPTGGANGVDRLLARQIALICEAAELRRLEAAWRSLSLMLLACDSRSGIALRVIAAPAETLAENVMAAMKACHANDTSFPEAVIFAESLDPRGEQRKTLGALAAAAAEASVPIIVDSPSDLFGRAATELAAMSDPGALLAGTGWEAWEGLRQKEEARWLGYGWNRPWLRDAHDLTQDRVLRFAAGTNTVGAPLAGSAAAVIGAMIAASLVRHGWPSEILVAGGVEVSGPVVIERAITASRRAALPLEAGLNTDQIGSLADAGLIALAARPDRDAIFLPLAQSVKRAGRIDGDSQLARHFASLPYALAAGRIARTVLHLHEAVSAAADPADMLRAAITDLIDDTGPGAAVETSVEADPDDPGQRLINLHLVFGRNVLKGATLDMALPLG